MAILSRLGEEVFIFPKIPEETIEQYRKIYESGIIVWHEPNRHGVIRGIKKVHVQQIYQALVYYLGPKCTWRKDNADNTVDLEIVYQGNGKNTRPWHWCGTTILFKEWQVREDTNYRLLDTFNLGDNVQFVFRNQVYKGILINKRKRATVLSGGKKFYVPAKELKKI